MMVRLLRYTSIDKHHDEVDGQSSMQMLLRRLAETERQLCIAIIHMQSNANEKKSKYAILYLI